MRRIAILIVTAALGLAACGGEDTGGNVDQGQPDPAGQSGGSAAEQGGGGTSAEGTIEIKMVDNEFEPSEATVKVGQTVSWTNAGQAPHDATGKDGQGGLKSGTVEPGGNFQWRPDQGGTVDYVCTIHPGMEGTLTIADN